MPRRGPGQRGGPLLVGGRAAPGAGAAIEVERFDRRGIEPFELLTEESGQNSWNPKIILSKFRNFR